MKDESIRVRMTKEDKQRIKEYAERHDMTISQVIRWACEQIFKSQE